MEQFKKLRDALHRWSAGAWAVLRDLFLVLDPCRFSLLVVAFGGALLLAVPQGREMMVRLADEPWSKSAWFCAAVAVWAFQSWYWARFILDATFGPDRNVSASTRHRPDRIRFFVDHVPRAIAFVAYAVAIAASLVSDSKNFGLAALLAALGIAFYALLVKRRDLTVALVGMLGRSSKRWLERKHVGEHSIAGLSPLSFTVFWISFGASAAWFAWACADPVAMGWTLGSSAVPFIGFACIVPVGSMAVYAGRGGGVSLVEGEGDRANDPHVGYPVVTLFIGLALLFSLWVDNHAVRPLEMAAVPHAPATPASAIQAWHKTAAGGEASVHMVIVATAGGGIRAAYWTATVLGALQDCVPSFRNKLLAISGVSGGSLGAVTFATLLAHESPPAMAVACPPAVERPEGWTPGLYESQAQKVLSQDFLAPTVSALLFSDLMQQFIPFTVLPDRAAALEKGWEQAWNSAAGYKAEVWSDTSFDDLWRGKQPVPALLLNGTSVESGRRVITSNLAVDQDVFHDSVDFFEHFHPVHQKGGAPVGRAIRPSTAAHNSARFTYVSPAGRMNAEERVVDGGYHENFGAKTASELLLAATAQLKLAGIKVHPIVVLISNDPEIAHDDLPRDSVGSACPACEPRPPKGIAFGSEALSPLWALLDTRNAHGTRAAFDLHDAALGRFYHFRLCGPKASQPALGWVLSKDSEVAMQRTLRQTQQCGNREQFDDLVRELSHQPVD